MRWWCGIGLILFSTLQNATQFFLYYLIVAMGASLAGFITIVTAVVNWFERRRSVALAAAQAGFPLGGVLTPLVVLSLTEFGWRQTAFWSAWIVLFLVVGLAQVMHKNPAAVGQEVDGGPPGEPGPNHEADAVETEWCRDPVLLVPMLSDPVLSVGRRMPVGRLRDFTLAEAVRTRAFWMLNFGHATALLVVGSTMAHLSIYLTEEQGFSLATAGWLGTSLLLTQLLGQVMGGWLGDRYSKRLLVIAAMVGHVIGMILFTFPTSTWMIWAFIPFHGLAWGVRGPLLQAIRADYFGASSFGRIMGWSALIMMLGTMSGPIIVGLLRDSTGSYTAGFTVITIGASLAVGFFFLATKPRPARRTSHRLISERADSRGAAPISEPPCALRRWWRDHRRRRPVACCHRCGWRVFHGLATGWWSIAAGGCWGDGRDDSQVGLRVRSGGLGPRLRRRPHPPGASHADPDRGAVGWP